MLFNSHIFIFIFLPIVLLGFYLLGRGEGRSKAMGFLVVASLVYYGWWNPKYLVLIVFSILFNYALGLRLASATSKWPLYFGIFVNLALIGYFKYANFFVDNLNAVSDGSFMELAPIVLPLGISFFTFQQIAYLIDAYRGEASEYNFYGYCLFVTFFPQLIAGPIVHHKEMMPQFETSEREGGFNLRGEDIAVGLTIFSIGLFKKVIIADNIALFSSPVFDAALAGAHPTFFESWSAALGYTMQLYFDFSGYSDMAIGLARLFGVKLPINFNSPYKAVNIIDFWRRWHITLSRFFRDYIYFPLGGSRRGGYVTLINLFVTMFLAGLWHGAGWTFVFWGVLHGVYLVINHAWQAARKGLFGHDLTRSTTAGRYAGTLLTFLAVVVSWVFFRAESFGAAKEILKGMAGLNGVALYKTYLEKWDSFGPTLAEWGVKFTGYRLFEGDDALIWIIAVLLIAWVFPNTQEVMRRFSPAITGEMRRPEELRSWQAWKPSILWAVITGVLCLVSIANLVRVSEFLYFQF